MIAWIATFLICLILLRPLMELMSAPYLQARSGEYLSSSWYGLFMDPRIHPLALGIQIGLALLLQLNLSTFREITCLHLCFIGRLLHKMSASGGVGFCYNAAIGEPRLERKPLDDDDLILEAPPKEEKTLACDNCQACIKSCPTGHDIRSGHTLHCVDCGACSDACLALRHKKGLTVPLISLHPLDGKPWPKFRWQRYAALVFLCVISLLVALHVHLSPSLILQMHSDGSRSHLVDLPGGSVAKQSFQVDVQNLEQRALHFKIKVHPKYPGFISEGAEIVAPANRRSLHTVTMTIPCKDIMMGNNHTGILIWDRREIMRAYFPITIPSPLGFAEEKPQQ
jgi:polyferredoxin